MHIEEIDGYSYGRGRLSRFTGHTTYDQRRGLGEPWIHDGKTYVTNGSLGLRVNAATIGPEWKATEDQAKFSANLDDYISVARAQIAFLKPVTFQLPEETPKLGCEPCEGSGRIHHECEHCECECTACKGNGYTRETRFIVLGPKAAGLAVSAKFSEVNMRWLTMFPPLPGLQISRATIAEDNTINPHYLTWDHGEGIIMRCRTPGEGKKIAAALYEEDLAPAPVAAEA